MNRSLRITGSSILLCTSLVTSAQAPAIQWQKCLGGSASDGVGFASPEPIASGSVQQTTDGGYIIAGYTLSNDGDVTGLHSISYLDAWVVKLNASGDVQWQKCLGGTRDDHAQPILQTTDGGYVMAGTTRSDDGDVNGRHGSNDVWVVKLDASGSIQWQKCLGGSEEEGATSIQQTTDGGFVVAGSTKSNDYDVSGLHGSLHWDAWVVKLDASGAIQWQKCLGGADVDEAGSIQQTSDGGYVMAGYTNSINGDVSGNHGGFDAWVVKLNMNGDTLWTKCFGGAADDRAHAVRPTADGGYIVAGSTKSNDGDVSGNHGGVSPEDVWVVKLDGIGDTLWTRCFGGTGTEWANALELTANGGYILAGSTSSSNGDVSGHVGFFTDMWVVRLDAAGSLQWQYALGGSEQDYGHSIATTADGGCIVGGVTYSNNGEVSGNHGNYDAWVVKLAPFFVGLDEVQPTRFTIAPNPTRSVFTVRHSESPAPQDMMLFDATGRTIMARSASALAGEFTVDLSGHESGIYLVKLLFSDGTRAVERVMKE